MGPRGKGAGGEAAGRPASGNRFPPAVEKGSVPLCASGADAAVAAHGATVCRGPSSGEAAVPSGETAAGACESRQAGGGRDGRPEASRDEGGTPGERRAARCGGRDSLLGAKDKMLPKKKCCMMGTFDSTSPLYIFSRPWLIFCQDTTDVMLYSTGECSKKGPCFTCAQGKPV